MATTFCDALGTPVARRSWGGDSRGTVVELLPGAAELLFPDEWLRGDDGSEATLLSLAREVGRGAVDVCEAVAAERRAHDRFPTVRCVVPRRGLRF